jgi:hypothetical protein
LTDHHAEVTVTREVVSDDEHESNVAPSPGEAGKRQRVVEPVTTSDHPQPLDRAANARDSSPRPLAACPFHAQVSPKETSSQRAPLGARGTTPTERRVIASENDGSTRPR